jgi:hypothetical protein
MKKILFYSLFLLYSFNVQSQTTLYACNNTSSTTNLVGIFNLRDANNSIVLGPNGYTFTYHHSNAEAQNGSNAIVNPEQAYTFIPSYTVYARARNNSLPSDIVVAPITLVINIPPVFNISVSGQTATVTITGAGNHSYKLDNNLAFVSYNNSFNNVWNNLSPGNHSFTYSNASGSCFYEYNFTIADPCSSVLGTTLTNCGAITVLFLIYEMLFHHYQHVNHLHQGLFFNFIYLKMLQEIIQIP